MKRALISLADTGGVEAIAQILTTIGWQIIATSETVKALKASGIDAEDVSDFTGVRDNYGIPPTLHPKIESALTMDVPYRIDLVYDIPYGSDKGNDIGGRTLLMLGAKGKRIVAMSPADMKEVLEQLSSNPTGISDELRQRLIEKACAESASHFLTLASGSSVSAFDGIIGRKHAGLLNGENPYQIPSELFDTASNDGLSLTNMVNLGAGAPCFTNMADTDSILHALCMCAGAFRLNMYKVPYMAIAAKHGNPCGMAIDWISPNEALAKALWGNPNAIWGGEFICNFPIDGPLANGLYESGKRGEILGSPYWMLDVVAAPDFDLEAINMLTKRSSRKVFKNPMLSKPAFPSNPRHYRTVRGGFLRQPYADYVIDLSKADWLFVRPETDVLESILIAWVVAWSSNNGGNETAIAKDRMLLSSGGGPSTYDSAFTAINRAEGLKHDLKSSVFCADAFFPFTDAPQTLIEAGCIAGAVPSGGKNGQMVRDEFLKGGVNVAFLDEVYRGFCRH